MKKLAHAQSRDIELVLYDITVHVFDVHVLTVYFFIFHNSICVLVLTVYMFLPC